MSSEPADRLLEAARRMHRARSVADVARALIYGAITAAPADTIEWRRRDVLHDAVRCRLHRLELALVQRSAISPEMGSDMKLEIRRQLERVLQPLNYEALPALCEFAVTAVAELAKACDALSDEALQAPPSNPDSAWSTLGGRLFIPAGARALARAAGLAEAELAAALGQATAPIRQACEPADVCRIGRLRHTREITPGLHAVASLDLSMGIHAGPLIRIELRKEIRKEMREEMRSSTDAPYATPDDALQLQDQTSRFPARLLRQLIS